MILINLLLGKISFDLKNKIISFIKSLESTFSTSSNEWDQFVVKLLFTIFSIKD